jgi:hypothetical protein
MERTSRQAWSDPAVRRLVVTVAALLMAVGTVTTFGGSAQGDASLRAATPQGPCQGPDDRPETGRQGRVPTEEYANQRYARGYQCNTVQVAHQGVAGGFKVQRYTDAQGHTCAFYDSTLLFPRDVLFTAAEGRGVVVLNMDDPTRPRKTAELTTPAMLSPHESLLVNEERGLLAAVLGNPNTNIGIVDIYDIREDCRHPELLSSEQNASYGHESGFSPDGRTFWVAGAGGGNLTAVDLTDPANPQTIFEQSGVSYHGLRLSYDGRTMFVANLGTDTGGVNTVGLRVLDVSEVQERQPDPQVRIVSDLTWPQVSIPQAAEPFTRNGKKYLLEVDEFENFDGSGAVGAARIIDRTDRRNPTVISNMRLEVHQPKVHNGEQRTDPGASVPVQGYAAHYCSVPYRENPKIVACSMILSGLRLFDISDLKNPVEVGYFNRPVLPGSRTLNPTAGGAFAMSQPEWDLRRKQVWYSDGNSGFYVVGLRGGIGQLIQRR